MATVSSDAYWLHLLYKAEQSRHELNKKKTMVVELRTLEFWRAIIAECLATFMYVFLICGSHVMWPLHSVNTLTKSFSNGFAMATAAQCFGHISGAHVNPAFTFAMLVNQKITPLRTFLYITAQCGGAIAGAALLYGVTVSGTGHREQFGCTLVHESLTSWQAMGLEMVLTFVVAFTMCSTADPNRRTLGSDALAVGLAYLICTLIALPATGASMNPARSLGPAFVMNTWTHHWVYWCGPVMGGLLAGLIYEYIFDSPRKISPTPRNRIESERDVPEIREESKSSAPTRPTQVHQGPCFRAPEGPRPHSRGPYTKYNQQLPAPKYYTTLPRSNRTRSNDDGSSSHFKF